MDQSTIQWVLMALVTVLGAGVSILFQNQLKRNDHEHNATIERIESHLRDHDTRIQTKVQRIQSIEIQLVEKVGREEIKEFYRMFESVKREWKEDLRELKGELIDAFNRREDNSK